MSKKTDRLELGLIEQSGWQRFQLASSKRSEFGLPLHRWFGRQASR